MRILIRVFGSILILGGLVLLGYAGFTYMQVQRVANLPANLPGAAPAGLETATVTALTVDSPVPRSTETTVAATAPTAAPPTSPPTPFPSATATSALRAGPAIRLFIRGKQDRKDISVREASWTSVMQPDGLAISDWLIPYDAVGHLINTPHPGQPGNAVISGHHNLVGPNLFGVGQFAYNWNLVPGDKLFTEDASGNVYEWNITQSYPLLEEGQPTSVREQHARQVMGATPDPTLTLTTCWAGPENPFASNTYRWIIISKLAAKVDSSSIPALGH